MTRFRRTLALFGALLLGSTSLAISARAGEHDGQQLYPLLSYRTGPYASSGIPQWAGRRDYITYVNDHGGVDGVKIFVQECEGFECYERYKNGYDGAPLAILVGTSSGFDVAASEKIRADKIPLTTPGGGREDAADGTVFPYQFPLLFDYWTEASIVVDYIAKQVGGYDKLKVRRSRPSTTTPATGATPSNRSRRSPRSMVSRTSRSRCRIRASSSRRNGSRSSSRGSTGSSSAPGAS